MWLTIALVSLVLALLECNVLAAEYTAQQAIAAGMQIRASSKGCYDGDCVHIYILNPTSEVAVVNFNVGDVLLSKDGSEQNLVVKAELDILVPATYAIERPGLYTFCLDARKEGPDESKRFDVAPNLRDWPSSTPAATLTGLLDEMVERGVHNADWAQQAVWKITDDHEVEGEARDVLLSIGVNPDEPVRPFPHLDNPNKLNPDTGYVEALIDANTGEEISRAPEPTTITYLVLVVSEASVIYSTNDLGSSQNICGSDLFIDLFKGQSGREDLRYELVTNRAEAMAGLAAGLCDVLLVSERDRETLEYLRGGGFGPVRFIITTFRDSR